MRVGLGYDLHTIGEGKFLTIGGMHIPYIGGFIAHSDGDVLIHAIIDAILGALGLPDIGELYPDSDPKYKNMDSTILLKEIYEKMLSLNYQIENLDCTIIAEKPKLSPYKEEIKNNLSKILHTENITVKAKTNEKVGDIGQGKAIASLCVVLLKNING
jgi:2-C-methyl-D-erythritol 2,4-cyclodiphosphate synthase